MRPTETILVLGSILAFANGFNTPLAVSTRHVSTTSTSLGLRRRRRRRGQPNQWIARSRLNQSAYTVGGSSGFDYVEEERVQKKETKTLEKETKAASVASSTMNLIKTILGTGVLALPAGVAAVSNMPIALVPTSILMFVLGVLSAYTFQVYGRLTHETQAESMGEIWEKTVGKKSSWVISAGTFAFCFGCALVYALVIGDFMSALAMSLGSAVPAIFAHRQFWILSVTLSTLVPLSNLKSLTALAPVSVLGTFGTLLTTIFMAIRCPAVVAGSPYSVAPGAVGKFAAAAAPSLAPKFGTFSNIVSPAALIIASMATTAYLGHFNAPAFYHGFKQTKSEETVALVDPGADATNNEKAMKNYGKMTVLGFAGCTLMNIIIMSLGFLTFGGNSGGVILNNYSTADKGAVISRLLMTISVIGGYPFMVGGCKAGFMQIYKNLKQETADAYEKVEKGVANAVITVATSLALLLSDAGLVVGLVGALMGSSIIYVFPSLMFLAHTGKQMQAGGSVSRKLKLERFASRFLTTFGIASGLIGAAVCVVNSIAPHLLH